MNVRMTVMVALAAMTGPAMAQAQDLKVLGGGKLELKFPQDGPTQELTAYVEAERDGFYGGLLGLRASDSTATELDLYAGYRAELERGFSYDLSYTRFFNPIDRDAGYGEIGLQLGQSIGEKAEVSGNFTYDPKSSVGGIELGTEYSMADKVTVSGKYGLFQEETGPATRDWDFGATYKISEQVGFDARYNDSSDSQGYFAILLSFDTTLFGK